MRPSPARLLFVLAFGVLAVAAEAAASTAPAPALSSAAPSAAPAQAAAPASAPTAVPAPAPPPTLLSLDVGAAQSALAALQNQAQTVSNDQRLAAMEAQADAVEAQAQAAVAGRTGDVARVDQALKRVVPKGRRATAADRAQERALQAERDPLAAQLQQARMVAEAADSTVNLIAERRREGFSARVLERSASPLSPGFWTPLAEAVGEDFVRLASATRDAGDVLLSAPEPKGLIGLGAGLAIALILVFGLRSRLEKLGRAKSGEAVHPGFARTGAALWIVAVDVGSLAFAAAALHLGAQWGGLLSEKADSLAAAAVIAVTWAAAILALGYVLVTDPDANRRLMAIPDAAARRLSGPLAAVALVTGAGFFLTRLNYVVGASVAATIATNCVLSLAYAAVAGLIVVSFGRGRAHIAAPEQEGLDFARSPTWTLVSLFLTTAIVVTLGAVLGGYTTLAALISSQIFWLSIIAATTYLLLRFVDDLCGLLFSRSGATARALALMFGLHPSTVSQAGLLVSAGVQLLILIGTISLALTPFGQSGGLVLSHFSQLGAPIRLGSTTVSPSAIAAGIATLIVGVGVVRLIQRWVNRRYLPLTDWDAGLRNSVSTGVGYLGVGLAVLCALSAMGFGFQQIALIASALSVGIGFGLQQIVQNFISGVILLVERPVKVGDWVNVGGVEGDIRRIRVRATEIRTFDRSTVIVPNSDLITKAVQNKTLGDPRSRIQLQLSIANPADAARAKQAILDAAKAHTSILADPAPAVYIDSLAGGGAVNFNAYLYVNSPRDVYRVRSELYFELLEVFQRETIAFMGAGGPQNVVVEPGPTLEAMLNAAADKTRPTTGAANPPSKRAR